MSSVGVPAFLAAWPYNHGGMSAARDDEDDDDAYNNDEEDDDEEENDNDDDDDDEDDSDAADFAGRKRRPGHRKQNNLIKKQKAKASLEPTLRSVSNAAAFLSSRADAAKEATDEQSEGALPHLQADIGCLVLEAAGAAIDESSAIVDEADLSQQESRSLCIRLFRSEHRSAGARAGGAGGRGAAGSGRAGPSEVTLACQSAMRLAAASSAHQLCNAGASVWALDWLPGRAAKQLQYLAVGTHMQGATYRPRSGRNAIQIWQVPSTSAKGSAAAEGATTFARVWLLLLHRGGGVLDLCWCPSGNAVTAPSSTAAATAVPAAAAATTAAASSALPASLAGRLGLLAAACADGSIRLFAVPTPAALSAARLAQLGAEPRAGASSASDGHSSTDVPSEEAAPTSCWVAPLLQLRPRVTVVGIAPRAR